MPCSAVCFCAPYPYPVRTCPVSTSCCSRSQRTVPSPVTRAVIATMPQAARLQQQHGSAPINTALSCHSGRTTLAAAACQHSPQATPTIPVNPASVLVNKHRQLLHRCVLCSYHTMSLAVWYGMVGLQLVLPRQCHCRLTPLPNWCLLAPPTLGNVHM
jgi:hypothetical protein